MKGYKVLFEQGKAMAAILLTGEEYNRTNKIGFNAAGSAIEWYVVDCEDEQLAIETADIVVNTIWGAIFGV